MSLRTQFSSFLSNEEIKPLLTQTVSLHLIRISATGVTTTEKITLGPLPSWFSLHEVKLALWNLKEKDPQFSPPLVFLAKGEEPDAAGMPTQYKPVDLVWLTAGGSERKDELSLVNPLSLMTGKPDPRFVDSAGGEKALTIDNRIRMSLSDVFRLEEGKLIPELYVFLYVDLIDKIIAPRPLGPRDVLGRIKPYFPFVISGVLPSAEGLSNADLVNQAKECKKNLDKLAYLDELYETLGGELKLPVLNGIKLMRLWWSKKPEGWDGVAPLFFGTRAIHERPYLRFFPSSGTPLSKLRILGEQPIPDLPNASVLKTWRQDKNPNPGFEFASIKLLIQESMAGEEIPIFATHRIFHDGTADLILLPPKQKRLLDPDTDLQEAPEMIEKAMDTLPYLLLQPALGQADVVFRLRLMREDTRVTREMLVQRLPCFSSVFQEIPPLLDEQPLIALRFKGVSNYFTEDRVFTFLTQLQAREAVSGASEIEKWGPLVAAEFQIPLEDARRTIVAWIAQRNEYSLAVPETKDFILSKNPGIDIAIFAQHPIYTFHVSRIQSFEHFGILKQLLGLFITGPADRFSKQRCEMSPQAVVAAAAAERSIQAIQPPVALPAEEEEEEVAFPDEDDVPEFLRGAIGAATDAKEEEEEVAFPNAENVPDFLRGAQQAAPEPVVQAAPVVQAPQVLERDAEEKAAFGKPTDVKAIGLAKYYIDRLKIADPAIFNYAKEQKEKGYVTHCAANVSRQPIVLDTEEFNEMRRIYENDDDMEFIVYPNDKDSKKFLKKQPKKQNDETSTLDGLGYPTAERPEVITIVRYGSSARKLHYYFCPRLFCIRDRLLVRYKDFKKTVDRKGSPKPANTCPFCKGTLIEEEDMKSKARDANKTVLQRKQQPSSDSERQIYIGFLKRKTPDGLALPCCFIDPEDRFDPNDPEFTRLGLKAGAKPVVQPKPPVAPVVAAAQQEGPAQADLLLQAMAPEPEQQQEQSKSAPIKGYVPNYYRVLYGASTKSIVDANKIPLDIIVPTSAADDPKSGPQVGLLPQVLDAYFEQDSNAPTFQDRLEIVRKLKATAKGFLRVATENHSNQRNLSLFSALAPYLGYQNNANEATRFIEARMTPKNFLQLNGGNLVNEFYNKCEKKTQNNMRTWIATRVGIDELKASNIPAIERLMNSFECFQEYLVDPKQRKDMRVFYQALSEPGVLMTRGILFIILEVTVEDSLVKKGDKTEFNREVKFDRVRCPPYPLSEGQQNADISFIIHYTEIIRDRSAPDKKSYRNLGWEPLFYVEPSTDVVVENQRHKPTLWFQRSEEKKWPPIVQKRVSEFFRECGSINRGPFTSQFGIDPNALIGANELITAVRINPNGIVRDSYNHLVGLTYRARAGKSELAVLPIADDGSIHFERRLYLDWDDFDPAAADDIIKFYKENILPIFSQYSGYEPKYLARARDTGKIVGIRLANGFVIPATQPRDPAAVAAYRVVDIDDLEWDINRTIAYDSKARERAFKLASAVDEKKDKSFLKLQLKDAQDELNDIYQHLRLTFSNWLAIGAGKDKRAQMEPVLKSNTLPLFEKRKRLDILLEGEVMKWLKPVKDADVKGEVGFLRVDCTDLDHTECENNGRCQWTQDPDKPCKIRTPESQEPRLAYSVPRLLYLRLVDELIRYATRRNEIFQKEIPRLTIRREKQQIGDQLIIPEGTPDWNMWWEYLRTEWMTPEKEMPKFFDEQFEPVPQMVRQDTRVLPPLLKRILDPTGTDPKAQNLVWNPTTTPDQPYLFLTQAMGRNEIYETELGAKQIREIALNAKVQVLYIPSEEATGRMLARAPGSTEAIILMPVDDVPGWISVRGTYTVKIPLNAVPEALRKLGLK